ncbi:MAG TPA: helix-turn-helix domain-containing protein [Terracidiphilus sp.]|jgi:AcrR family transcriptional regulator|nr:helix-turn-helix domain-containing protein [Terracidiphilus sp.]
MDQNRGAILRAARAQLEAKCYREPTMASLAAETGVTRQTIHNLFGTKAGVLESLFDVLALDGGMENMRLVMTQPTPEAMLERFIQVFCGFWAGNRILFRRIHGIGAIDPVFGAVLEDRNRRRLMAATRIANLSGVRNGLDQAAAALAALTSFGFYDALAPEASNQAAPNQAASNPDQAAATILGLARDLLSRARS